MRAVFSTLPRTAAMERAGFRFGERGTHTSRMMMLRELEDLLAVVPPDASCSRRSGRGASSYVEPRYRAQATREDLPLLPEGVLREAVVNAVIHRDYAQTGAPVLLEVFRDRVEVTSPGTLPNHMTVARRPAAARRGPATK